MVNATKGYMMKIKLIPFSKALHASFYRLFPGGHGLGAQLLIVLS